MPFNDATELRLRLIEAIAPAIIAEWHRYRHDAPEGAALGSVLQNAVDVAHRVVISSPGQK